MRILLISPSTLNAGEWTIPYFDLRGYIPPLGILILKEIVRQPHDVEVISYDHAVNDVRHIVKKSSKSDITGFSLSNFFQYPATRKIIQTLKEEEVDTKIVLGGPFSTYQGQFLCKDGADIVVCGEGEIVFPHLLRALETGEPLTEIPGLVFRNSDNAVTGTGFAPLPQLDRIPLPCYDELPLGEAGYKYMSCETSRGCPNDCSFCTVYPRRTWRAYSPEKAVTAIDYAYKYIEYAKMPYVFLADSNFTVSAKRINQMAELTDGEIPVYCPAQLNHLNENVVADLEEIGIKAVFMGIEAVSENTLTTINKKIVGSVEKKCQLLLDHSIIPRLSFIFGLPGEGKASVISSLKYIKHMVELFGENMNVVVFPYRKDLSTTFSEFENLKSLETTVYFLMPDHDQKFRKWVIALVYLVNTYHNTQPPEEQVVLFDRIIKSSPQTVIELAETYEGKQRPWLYGFQKYFQSDTE